jgi:hypothetical protein
VFEIVFNGGNSNADRTVGERSFGILRRRERTISRRERDEERIALRIDLDAAVRAERLAQNEPVRVECIRVPFRPELVEQSRRALDVPEEKGDGARRKFPRHAAMIIDFGRR